MKPEQQIYFTVAELEDILKYLGELPAKYSLDLIAFIKNKAASQIQEVEAKPEADVVETK